jgi:hypothetical protein
MTGIRLLLTVGGLIATASSHALAQATPLGRRPAQSAPAAGAAMSAPGGAPAVPSPPAAARRAKGSAVPSRTGRARIVRVKTKQKMIEDLVFSSNQVQVRFLAIRPGGEPVAVLQGRFARQGWNVVFDTHAVFTPKPGKEFFRIGIPISDDITPVKVTAVGPRGQTKVEKFFVQFEGGREAFLAFLTGKELEPGSGDDGPRPADWSLLVRYAQSNTLFGGADADNPVPVTNQPAAYSGAAFTGSGSAELRWRGPRKAGQKWTWSGSLNLEMLRQRVLNQSLWMPRGYVRGFFGAESGKWRYGMLAQIQGGTGGVPVAETDTRARQATVTRYGAGLGGFAVYRPTPTLGLSALALVRMDRGGQSNQLTTVDQMTALDSNLGWEAGFGVVLGLSRRFYLEGRMRGLAENYSWAAATTNDFKSSFSATFIILDFGIGYKF